MNNAGLSRQQSRVFLQGGRHGLAGSSVRERRLEKRKRDLEACSFLSISSHGKSKPRYIVGQFPL